MKRKRKTFAVRARGAGWSSQLRYMITPKYSKYLRLFYRQRYIKVVMPFYQRITLDSASAARNNYAYFTVNDPYDPYVGLSNNSALGYTRAFQFFGKLLVYKSKIRVTYATTGTNNGYAPEMLLYPASTQQTSGATVPLDDQYEQLCSNTKGVKYTTSIGSGSGYKLSLRSTGSVKDLYPNNSILTDPNFTQTYGVGPVNRCFWNIMLRSTYEDVSSKVPVGTITVSVLYYGIMTLPLNNTF